VSFLDQAFGKPQERVEVRQPDTLEELSRLPTEQLLALLARARADAASIPL
jgi:hypothetical protein